MNAFAMWNFRWEGCCHTSMQSQVFVAGMEVFDMEWDRWCGMRMFRSVWHGTGQLVWNGGWLVWNDHMRRDSPETPVQILKWSRSCSPPPSTPPLPRQSPLLPHYHCAEDVFFSVSFALVAPVQASSAAWNVLRVKEGERSRKTLIQYRIEPLHKGLNTLVTECMHCELVEGAQDH